MDDHSNDARANLLRPGVPYVRGWSEARDAARELAEELKLLGLADDFAYLQGDVNVVGKGHVRLGRVTSDAAGRLTEALVLGLCVEIDRLPCAQEPAHDDRPTPA
ncbi:hypothetical protein [Streptomyces sp. SID3343]|uniref:hypothetical protein n=1 Tax=Streptomyces sp. SID3343 TaxID=2690260 RepID=UPI001368C756|nr:hypothetical protein [Streptomyces sp. SID3343]MYW04520.1 hypothetical protein [Streptomyces sp. SID3343]